MAVNVDHALVISLLGQIVVLLQVTLKDLKVIVVADLTLNGVACTLRELAGLLIVRISYILWLLLNVSLLASKSYTSISFCRLSESVSLMSPSAASLPPLGILCKYVIHLFYLAVSLLNSSRLCSPSLQDSMLNTLSLFNHWLTSATLLV